MNNNIKVKVYGFNLNKIINYLIDKKVVVYDLKIKSKFIIFVISDFDKNILDKCCKLYGKNYDIIKRFSLVESIKQIKFYFGGIFAIILVLCYLLSFNFKIFDIKVYNDTSTIYDLEKVNNLLIDCGIVKNLSIKKIRSSDIENLILNNFNDIAGCSVYVLGGKIDVKIYPEVLIENNRQINLFSKYDAVLTNIEIYSGDTKYKIGDVVKCGDLLVNSDNFANANICGNVYFSSSILHNKYRQSIKYTGRFLTDKTISIFNKNLLNRRNDIYFTNYSIKNCEFYIMENYLFPIKCQSKYYFEYQIIEEVVEFEEVEDLLKLQAYNEAYLKIPEGANILNTYYSVVREGDLTRLDCFIEANVSLI